MFAKNLEQTSLYWVAKVLTLPAETTKGHLPYPSQSEARPTTHSWGGATGRPVQVAPETERLVLSVAVSAGTWGCSRIAAYLARTWRVHVAPSTVRILRRAGLATRRARLTVLEHRAAQTAGLLTERTRRRLWEARHGQTRHVEAHAPGALLCLDSFYIGRLKRVGKVWQLTACDAACSYGVAWLVPVLSAAAAAAFLRQLLGPCTGGRAGGSNGCSPTAVRSSGGPSMRSVASWASATRGPSPGMPGPTASWSGCKGRSSRNTGGWPSGAATSPAGGRCSAVWTRSCDTTTITARIRAIASAGRHQRPCFGGPPRRERMHHSGKAKVQTPLRVWTV